MKKTLTLISIFVACLLSSNTFAATATMGPCQESSCVDYFKQYKKYARMGYADAMVTLAEMYYYGHGTEKNMKSALKQFRSAAKYGSVKGQYKTAMMYINNAEFMDLDKGVKYLKKAARNNNVSSSFLLGIMYFSPDFYEQDFDEADKWLSKAYRKGFKKMPAYIEFMKESGHFKEADFPDLMEAIEDAPIAVTEVASAKVASDIVAPAIVAPDVAAPAIAAPAKSTASTKTSGQTAQNAEKSDIEVITVYGNLNDIFDAQLASLRNTYPEKGAQTTGSRIIGKTCAQTMSCAPTSDADFNRGVRRVMGDHAVAKFHEAYMGKAGF
ncbi:tetratricopeptide repeat protein [Thalassotalea sp. ND16A]|uniref:tetratricopeptide repeat protein n=1 Tax=Thalassotalea sp. ND16A TaxID=1535422 RepID=UPI00051A1C16|nr:tetratricopeptide repeat protein [Thalassotalea sp. ND16A]KGK01100.1 hypothetical protein ND16A_3107 [Thalassotalea sp. ND16A]